MTRRTPFPLRHWRWAIPPRWLVRARMVRRGRYRYLVAPGSRADRLLLGEAFEWHFGYPPSLDEPRTFNEKLQWRKLHDRRRLLSLLTDKYEVRGYVRERLGHEYLVPLLHVARSVSEVPLGELSGPVAVKPSHTSGVCVRINRPGERARRLLQARLDPVMKEPHGVFRGEWAYWTITPRVLVEPLLQDPDGRVPVDYKFHCFDGEARFVEVHLDRFGQHRCAHFTRDWTPLDLRWGPPPPGEFPGAPSTLGEMLRVAETLAQGLDYVRVDLYEVGRRIYFGEMTVYPASGLDPTDPPDWDLELGGHWTLPVGQGTRLPAIGRQLVTAADGKGATKIGVIAPGRPSWEFRGRRAT